VRFETYRRHDATGLAGLITRGEVTADELLECALARAAEVNPEINAITVDDEAFARRALAAGLPDGPFRGVPFLLKDLFAFLEGTALTNGSRFFAGFKAPMTSTFVARCLAAGLVPFGKTASPEFGVNVTTEPVLHGPCRNPWDRERSPGGSSGGSAAAVAAGIVPMAHASDGGGSIRIPASSCGLVGLKPSRARTPVGPVVGEAWNGLALPHVVCRSIRDAAALLDAVSGPEPGDPYACPPPPGPFRDAIEGPPARLRIGRVTRTPLGTPVDPVCLEAVADAARLLDSLGHIVETVELDIEGERLAAAMAVIVGSNLASDLEVWQAMLGRRATADNFEAVTLALAERGRTLSAVDLARSLAAMHQNGRRLGRQFEQVDLLLMPTLAAPPPPLGIFDQTMADLDRFLVMNAEHIPFTALFNMTGCPAISLPLFWSPEGLPIGVMLGGRLGDETTLLRLGAELEAARPWFDRTPPL